MIQEDIYKTLSENAGVIAIASSRIYPDELPQGSIVPAVVYTSEIVPIKSLDGESGIDNVSVEIICWAKDYPTAHLLANAVRSACSAANIGITTENMQDTRNEETRNFGVIVNMVGLL